MPRLLKFNIFLKKSQVAPGGPECSIKTSSVTEDDQKYQWDLQISNPKVITDLFVFNSIIQLHGRQNKTKCSDLL